MIGVIAMVSNNKPVESATTPGTCLPVSKGGTGVCSEEDLLSKTYPVGSIYVSVNSSNPSTYLGGVWEEFGGGRTLVGVGDNGTTNYANSEETGGADSVTLTIDQMPSHTHTFTSSFYGTTQAFISGAAIAVGGEQIALSAYSHYQGAELGLTIDSTGGGQAHENRSAYITVYFWKRVG